MTELCTLFFSILSSQIANFLIQFPLPARRHKKIAKKLLFCSIILLFSTYIFLFSLNFDRSASNLFTSSLPFPLAFFFFLCFLFPFSFRSSRTITIGRRLYPAQHFFTAASIFSSIVVGSPNIISTSSSTFLCLQLN